LFQVKSMAMTVIIVVRCWLKVELERLFHSNVLFLSHN
jgi:hypothetical protein